MPDQKDPEWRIPGAGPFVGSVASYSAEKRSFENINPRFLLRSLLFSRQKKKAAFPAAWKYLE
jgi:hypothetical protein